MKIVSLNLWNGGRLFDKMCDFLIKQNADIYLLQEAYNGDLQKIKAHLRSKFNNVDHNNSEQVNEGQAGKIEDRFRTVELLKKSFPDHQASFSALYLDVRSREGKIDDGQLILSRYPIKKSKLIFFDTPYGEHDNDNMIDFSIIPTGVQKTLIEVDDHSGKKKELTLLNVHGPWNPNGTADTAPRLRMQKVLLENLGEYTILAGDFNVQPETVTIKGIEQRLTSVFKDEMTTSFNLKNKDLVRNPGFVTAVVDMVFVTPNIRVLNKQIPKNNVSDHKPLVAELEI